MLTFFLSTLGAGVIVILLENRNDLSSDLGGFNEDLNDLSMVLDLSSS